MFDCVWLYGFCPDPKFFIFETEKGFIYFSEDGGWYFMILCYCASHLQQIHWSKLLCGMYGLTAKSSVATMNICQLLMICPESRVFCSWNSGSSLQINQASTKRTLFLHYFLVAAVWKTKIQFVWAKLHRNIFSHKIKRSKLRNFIILKIVWICLHHL